MVTKLGLVSLVDQVQQDVRYALRTLGRTPVFTVAAVLTLSLGIAGNTAVFSLINAALLKPINAPNPERLVRVVTRSASRLTGLSPADYDLVQRHATVFSEIAAHRLELVNVTDGTNPVQVAAGRVGEGFFRLYGLAAARGRTFSVAEDRPGGPRVTVLSHEFWQRRFDAQDAAVGTTISLGEPHVIVGVLNPGVETEQFDQRPDLWVPYRMDPTEQEGGPFWTVSARLGPDVTLDAGAAQLEIVTEALELTDTAFPYAIAIEPMRSAILGDAARSLRPLFGAVGLVLLIACANVACLLLVRATGRRRELAIRAALGGGRARLLRQLLTEHLVLSVGGGALGLFLGTVGLRALLAVYTADARFLLVEDSHLLPRLGEQGAAVGLDWRVFAFTTALSIGAALLFGLLPAFQASSPNMHDALKIGTRHNASTVRQHRTRAALVVSQLALTVTLLIGAALLIRTSWALRSVDPGFDGTNVVTMRMSVTRTPFETQAGIARLTQAGGERLRALPGVSAAGAACCVPLETVWQLSYTVPGRPLDGAMHGMAGWTFVSPGYFEVLDIPLLRGRTFRARDDAGAPGVVVINEALARQLFPDSDPLNEQLLVGRGILPVYDADPVRRIVGVVGNVRDQALTRSARPAMYVPMAQVPDDVTQLLVRLLPLAWFVRTSGRSGPLLPAIENELEGASGLPVASVRSMNDVRSQSIARREFDMWLMLTFAGIALLLSAVGVYGVVAYVVRSRTPEMGIRLALGADVRQLRNIVMMQGGRIVGLGLAAGLVAAYVLAAYLASFVFDVRTRDVSVFVTVALLLGTLAMVAVWLPARRIARIDPVQSLRTE